MNPELMMNESSFSPMLAKSRDTAATETSSRSGEESSSSDESPDVLVDRILEHLGEDRYGTARRLAMEARRRFPDHPRVLDACAIFDQKGKARPGPEASEPCRDEELEWLRNPPQSARGKWVALLGSTMIDAAEDLADLQKSLRTKKHSRPVLVHFVA